MEDRAQKSREFMADPMKWPYMVLPVKQRKAGGVGQLGVMFDERPRVYTVSMSELSNYKDMDLNDIPHKDYPDLYGVVDDGWVVD